MKYTQKWMVVPFSLNKDMSTDINENIQQVLQQVRIPDDKKVKEYNQLLAKQVLQSHPIVPSLPPEPKETGDVEKMSIHEPNINQQIVQLRNDMYDNLEEILETHREEIINTILERLKGQPKAVINKPVTRTVSTLDKSRSDSSLNSSKIANHTRSKAKKKIQALDTVRNIQTNWELFNNGKDT